MGAGRRRRWRSARVSERAGRRRRCWGAARVDGDAVWCGGRRRGGCDRARSLAGAIVGGAVATAPVVQPAANSAAKRTQGPGHEATPRFVWKEGPGKLPSVTPTPFSRRFEHHRGAGDRTSASLRWSGAVTVAGLCRNSTGFATQRRQSEVVGRMLARGPRGPAATAACRAPTAIFVTNARDCRLSRPRRVRGLAASPARSRASRTRRRRENSAARRWSRMRQFSGRWPARKNATSHGRWRTREHAASPPYATSVNRNGPSVAGRAALRDRSEVRLEWRSARRRSRPGPPRAASRRGSSAGRGDGRTNSSSRSGGRCNATPRRRD